MDLSHFLSSWINPLSAPLRFSTVLRPHMQGGSGTAFRESQGGIVRDVLSVLSSFLVHLPLQEWTPAVLLFCTPDQLCDQNEKFKFQYLWFNRSFHLQENLLCCPWEMHGREKWNWGPSMSLWRALSLVSLFNFFALLWYWKCYLDELNANFCSNWLADFKRCSLISWSYKWEESGKFNKTRKIRVM